jgi:ankyrin repeat protein
MESVRQHMASMGLNFESLDSDTKMLFAAMRGCTTTVKELAALGADVKAADYEGKTALIWV